MAWVLNAISVASPRVSDTTSRPIWIAGPSREVMPTHAAGRWLADSRGVRPDTSWNQRRLVNLRDLDQRWIAEYPAILDIDLERARHHEQAIADLAHLIVAVEGQPRAYAIPTVLERV